MNRQLSEKVKNMNSKRLFDEINEFVKSGLLSLGIRWSEPRNRNSFTEIIEEWLDEFYQNNRITQYNVICDDRNNPPSLSDEGIFRITIKYKQVHCLNTTTIMYELNETDDEIEELLDFVLTP